MEYSSASGAFFLIQHFYGSHHILFSQLSEGEVIFLFQSTDEETETQKMKRLDKNHAMAASLHSLTLHWNSFLMDLIKVTLLMSEILPWTERGGPSSLVWISFFLIFNFLVLGGWVFSV